MTASRRFHTATLLSNGKVLVAGGLGSSDPKDALSSVELYDSATGVWMAVKPMKTARRQHAAILLPNGKVLVAGGWGRGYLEHDLSSVEVYDPATGTWTAGNDLAIGKAGHTATLLPNGKVLIAGGHAYSGSFSLASNYPLRAIT